MLALLLLTLLLPFALLLSCLHSLPCACFSSHTFVLPSISFYTALQMVRRLKTSHAGAAHQYAPQEQYNDFHDGDTDEEI
jgi:hypothetical protein